MLASPFLTDIDPQAAVKGSRDPLGIQPIWTRFGRTVVGNLTTITTSARDFSTTLLGYHFAERVAEIGKSDDLNVFLRWEQLAAHARYRVNKVTQLRGIERVKAAESSGKKITIAADSSGQILSNQRTYGLWGLYSGSAISSGLIEGEPRRTSAVGRKLVEDVYLPAFTKAGLRGGNDVVKALARERLALDADGKDGQFLRAIAQVLSPTLRAAERTVFREHLLLGRWSDKTEGRQQVLAKAIIQTLSDESWGLSPSAIAKLGKRCRNLGPEGEATEEKLTAILTVERLLAPCAALFQTILASDGQTVEKMAGMIRKAWGPSLTSVDPAALAALEPQLQDNEPGSRTGDRWVAIARALFDGAYVEAVTRLVEQNAHVMSMRGGAGAWVTVDGSKLNVRFRDDRLEELPSPTELPELWRHSYFLEALRAIAFDLEGVS